jgi:hypothetical protein
MPRVLSTFELDHYFVIRHSCFVIGRGRIGRQAMFTPEWPMLGYRLDDAEPAISVA